MKEKLLAQAINFPTLMQQALPTYTPGKIDLKKVDLKIGDVISAILPYIFVIAGLILFFLLIASGFELMTGAGNPDTQKKPRQNSPMLLSALSSSSWPTGWRKS